MLRGRFRSCTTRRLAEELGSFDRYAHYDASEMSAFDVDEIIHHYTRAARELWKFCGVTGSQIKMTAATLVQLQQDGQEHAWWEIARPRRS